MCFHLGPEEIGQVRADGRDKHLGEWEGMCEDPEVNRNKKKRATHMELHSKEEKDNILCVSCGGG